LALFVPEQAIDEAQFVAFAECFGTPIVAKRTTSKSRPEWAALTDRFPEIVVLDEDDPKGKGSDLWHADSTYQPDPPLAITLRSVRLPVEGGDTCFASMYAAYAAHPEFQCRHRWNAKSIAVWDNWSTQHLGVPDYDTRRNSNA
jgi:alpha-ketoglutarate-dependent taurine dioxygenase